MPGASGIKALLKSPHFWSTAGGSTILPLAMDYRMNDDPNAVFGVTTIKDLVNGKLGKDRGFNLIVNSLLGGLSGGLTSRGAGKIFKGGNPEAVASGTKMLEGGLATAMLAPAKDLLFSSQELPSVAKDTAKKLTESADSNLKLLENTAHNAKMNTALLGALGVGALGLGGLGIYKYLTNKKEKEGAKIKLRLPGKKGDPDSAAMVELPINMPEFSPALTEGLDRAVRLRTRRNIRANSMKRDPQTGKLIPYDEWKARYGGGAAGAPEGGAFPPAFAKAAASRETHERFGELVSSFLPSVAGALAGSYLGGQGTGSNVGRIVGGIAGGLLPAILGRAAAAISGPRTIEEQEIHDSEKPLLEYIVPGYAAFQAEKRDRAEEDDRRRTQVQMAQNSAMLGAAISAIPSQGQSATSPGALGSVDNPIPAGGMDDYEDDDDDLEGAPQAAGPQNMPLALDDDDDWEEKDASAGPPPEGPPPPPGGDGGQGGPPPPTPGGSSRPVPPDQNAPAKGIDSSSATAYKAVQNQAQNAERQIQTYARNTETKQQNEQPAAQPASLADIPNVLGEFHERLRNLV